MMTQDSIGTVKVSKSGMTYAWLVVLLASFFYCYEYFLRITPSVMTPELMHAFNITAGPLGMLTAAYYYAYTPMQLPVGIMMDNYDTRKVLSFACLMCAIGSYAFAMTNNLWVAGAGRLLIGFGSAFAFVGVLKLATLLLPPRMFGFVSGITTTLGMLGAMFGDIFLNRMVLSQGWKSTIILSAHVGVITTLALYLIIPTFKKEKKNADSSNEPVSSEQVSILKDVIAIFKMPEIWLLGLVGLILYLSLSVMAEMWGPHYLMSAFGMQSQDAADSISLVFAGWAIGAPLFGALSDWMNDRVLFLQIGTLLGGSLIALLIFFPPSVNWEIQASLFLFGIFTSAEILVFALAKECSPIRLAGTALAVTNMIIMVGGIIFQPLVGILLDSQWSGQTENGIQIFTASEYNHALLFLPLTYILAMTCTLFLRKCTVHRVQV